MPAKLTAAHKTFLTEAAVPQDLVDQATAAGFDWSKLFQLAGPLLMALLQAFLAGKQAAGAEPIGSAPPTP